MAFQCGGTRSLGLLGNEGRIHTRQLNTSVEGGGTLHTRHAEIRHPHPEVTEKDSRSHNNTAGCHASS